MAVEGYVEGVGLSVDGGILIVSGEIKSSL